MSGSWHPHGHWNYSTNCRIYKIRVVKQYDLSKEQTNVETAYTRKIIK
jgi:hypothetical protein